MDFLQHARELAEEEEEEEGEAEEGEEADGEEEEEEEDEEGEGEKGEEAFLPPSVGTAQFRARKRRQAVWSPLTKEMRLPTAAVRVSSAHSCPAAPPPR